MFSFILLCIILLIFVAIAAVLVTVGGGAFILVFGDAIICIWLIIKIIKKIFKKK